MAENSDTARSSPPLPKRGQYNIDFDDLDEFSNPFASKKALGSSPPIKSNPIVDYENIDDSIDPFNFKSQTALTSSPPGKDNFNPKSKLDTSPPATEGNLPDVEDPFKSNAKLANSSPKVVSHNNNVKEVGFDDGTQELSAEKSQENDGKDAPAEEKQSKSVTPKKKKIMKKPKTQSKLKPPRDFKKAQGDSDDIQIVMPGVDDDSEPKRLETDEIPNGFQECQKLSSENSTEIKKQDVSSPKQSSQPGPENRVMLHEGVGEVDEEVPYDAAPDEMASSTEIDRQFLDRDGSEERDHVNEECVPTNEALADPTELDLVHKFGDEREGKTSKSSANQSLLSHFDPSTDKHSSKNTQPSRDSCKTDKDVDLLTSSPGQVGESSSSKHPAARILDSLQAKETSTPAEGKTGPSLEESQFFDALDYPPTSASTTTPAQTKPKSGQKKSGMDRDVEGNDDRQGAVVQLVQANGSGQVLRYSQTDWNKLKQELELSFQTSLLNKERDWSLLLAERDKKLSALEDANRKLKNKNEDMRMVVTEFEKTISQLQSEKEKTRSDFSKNLQTVKHERDQALEDLQSVENAFSDLHRRYEKSKIIIDGFKKNEEQLKQCVEDLQSKLKKSEAKMQSIKAQAEEKLDKANEDVDKLKKATRQDIIRLEAAVKKSDLRIFGLDESLQRKEKENLELTAICDELISKVG